MGEEIPLIVKGPGHRWIYVFDEILFPEWLLIIFQ